MREPAPEVRLAMMTKGKGWSGREGPPEPPNMGPGPREDHSERFGHGQVGEPFGEVEDPLNDIPDDAEVDPTAVLGDASFIPWLVLVSLALHLTPNGRPVSAAWGGRPAGSPAWESSG